ncbi:MAG: hypothetical protein R3C15_19530 [Thermoleophilia bacterium]
MAKAPPATAVITARTTSATRVAPDVPAAPRRGRGHAEDRRPEDRGDEPLLHRTAQGAVGDAVGLSCEVLPHLCILLLSRDRAR